MTNMTFAVIVEVTNMTLEVTVGAAITILEVITV